MPSTPASPPAPDSPVAVSDDRITVASISVLAYILTNIAHEGAGHAFGFYLAGGKSGMLTTTRLIEWVTLPDPQWRLFDLGGPAGNLALAFLAWLIQRFVRQRPVPLRFFLWLVLVFSLLWAFGYMIFCGLSGRGDWMALIEGTRFFWPGRVLFVLLGYAFYRASIHLAAREMRCFISAREDDSNSRIARLIWISYLAAGLIACAGPLRDPRGPMEILNAGALSSFGAFVGLFFVRGNFLRLAPSPTSPPKAISWDLPWILAAAAGAIYFVGILGPGILIYLGD